MRCLLVTLNFFVLFSCSTTTKSTTTFKSEFNLEDEVVLTEAKKLISSAYYATFITQDEVHQPRARVVEPFFPEKDYTVWIATNPKSRKVKQLQQNNKATLHYFDKAKLGYVSLMGKAYLVDDEAIKKQKWKKGWEKIYPKRDKDFMLIKFIPETLELISLANNFSGDKETWKPHQVILRE